MIDLQSNIYLLRNLTSYLSLGIEQQDIKHFRVCNYLESNGRFKEKSELVRFQTLFAKLRDLTFKPT
jgi:hypothetical protein